MIKAEPVKWNKRKNWNTLQRLIRQAADQGAKLAITPECFLDGYVASEKRSTQKKFRRIAERGTKGTYIKKASALAKELSLHLVVGFTDTPDGKTFYNAAYLFDPRGRVAGKYYKIHTGARYTPGDALPVFHTRFGRVGILICADRRWPENTRILAVKGAEAILIPSYGMWHEANECWMRTRGYENGVYICFAHPKVAFVVNPKGNVEAKLAGNVDDVLIHDLDPDAVTHAHLGQRRPALYQTLTEPL
jgi:predicted amidohydrolase